MLNVLYEQFPEHVIVHGIQYQIETDFREWIRFYELVEDDTVPWMIKVDLMLRWFCDDIPDDLESAIYALGDFLSARELYEIDEDSPDYKSDNECKEPVFSFSEDAGCIYGAFVDCYGIDLQTVPYMHWWKFWTLLDGLPHDTEIKQRIMYRSIDVNSIEDKEEKKRVKKIQREIALKKKNRCMSDYEIGDAFA